jgi:hypothetical protein
VRDGVVSSPDALSMAVHPWYYLLCVEDDDDDYQYHTKQNQSTLNIMIWYYGNT